MAGPAVDVHDGYQTKVIARITKAHARGTSVRPSMPMRW
jgi:hypothetical protein